MAPLIHERYEPMEVVTQGPRGEVIRALDHRHGRAVALKLRVVAPGEDRESLMAAAGRLLRVPPHPRLPVVRDEFFVDDRHCLVVDWVAGHSLQDRLDLRGHLSPAEVVTRVGEIAEALEHLHTQSPPVAHGDVRPANARLGAKGTAVLVDLGLGCPHPFLPARTSRYTAPELMAGDPYTPAGDIYALAATALALLSDQRPQPGITPNTEGNEERGQVGPALEFALRRGLATDPARRPPSVAAFTRAMGEAIASPPSLSAFVGRCQMIVALRTRLGETRLVTLTGGGGIGKTRLARRVAGDAAGDFLGAVFFADLGPVADPAMVVGEILASSGGPHRPGCSPIEALLGHLGGRATLMVLDNCDHVVTVCAELVERMLGSCPQLRILATSREPLRVPGERVFVVSPLSTPAPEEDDPAALAGHEAVQLFVQAAARARGQFTLTSEMAPAVAELCRRLDGLPLALELAAAASAELTIPELVQRTRQHFELPVRASSWLVARHHSLQSNVAWSYDTLSAAEQHLFDRLSQHDGDFDLEAAERVGEDGGEAADVFGLLSAIVDKSLVVATADGETTRYRILGPLRRFDADAVSHRSTRAGMTELP